jgi:protein TonB
MRSAFMSATLSPSILTLSAGRRDLVIGVGASLALHALMLAFFPGLSVRAPVPKVAPVFSASLTPRAAEPETALPSAAPAPRQRGPAPATHAYKPLEEAAPAVQPIPDAPAPAPPALAPVFDPPPAQPERGAPGAIVLAPRAPELPAPDPPAKVHPQPARSPETDPGSLDQYRLALIMQARRYKRYPMQAMERGWAGTVEVRLVIAPDGTVRDTLVKASSGYRILDDQALDMVKKAKPLTVIPPVLRGREFSVDIPVIFDLQTG